MARSLPTYFILGTKVQTIKALLMTHMMVTLISNYKQLSHLLLQLFVTHLGVALLSFLSQEEEERLEAIQKQSEEKQKITAGKWSVSKLFKR